MRSEKRSGAGLERLERVSGGVGSLVLHVLVKELRARTVIVVVCRVATCPNSKGRLMK